MADPSSELRQESDGWRWQGGSWGADIGNTKHLSQHCTVAAGEIVFFGQILTIKSIIEKYCLLH